MDDESYLIAKENLNHYKNVKFVCDDAKRLIAALKKRNEKFDFIFADTWAGKYKMLDETLGLLNERAS